MSTRAPSVSRRSFMALAGSAAFALPALGNAIQGANDRVRIALVGCGGRARSLASMFAAEPGAQLAAVCDPDTARMDGLLNGLKGKLAGNEKTAGVDLSSVLKLQDYRRVYERSDVDAVVVATPNHWHSLHAIQAMQAGKDVYVEKPVSHSVWEGQQLVAAEKKYDRIVAAGFQNRSDPGPQAGIRYVQEGNLGKIESVHVCCFRNRSSIGARRSEPLTPPASCDYDLWLGPAQDEPMFRPKFHYDWHWVWNTGNGDIGNQAPHEIDLACWLLGDGALPCAIRSMGGRFGWNDAGETPNLMTAWYEQAGVPVIIEVNDLKLSPERNVSPTRNHIRVGMVVKCEGGELRGGRGGMYVIGEDGKTKVKRFPGDGGRAHQKNFIEAVRSRDRSSLAVSIASAERSCAVAHLANASLRSGGSADSGALAKAAGDRDMIHQILSEQSSQLAAWGIEEPLYTLGSKLAIDPATREVSGAGLDQELIRTPGRDAFVVPSLV